MAKKRLATAWMQSCSGCHISLLDIGETLIDVADMVDVVYTPIADVKEFPKADVVLVEGAVANEENEATLKAIRESSDVLVALGTCACHGGIGGLRNLLPLPDVMQRGFVETPSTEGGAVPDSEVPALCDAVRPLGQVVEVDYMLPGCPPPSESIAQFVVGLLNGQVEELPTHNLCEECERVREKMLVPQRGFILDNVHAVFELEDIDPTICFLEQGVLCMGPMTREGCGTRCVRGNMPCRGCMGPTKGAREQGCKMIDSLASILPAGAIMYLEDVVGTGYRFSLPVSICPKLTVQKGGER